MYRKWLFSIICLIALFFTVQLQKNNYIHYASKLKNSSDSVYDTKLDISSYETLGQMVSKENAQKNSKKTAYLTFDDGPSKVTEIILDTLKTEKINATFFLVGKAITSDMESTVKRIYEDGHTIGIHTYSHKSDIYHSIDSYLEDFEKVCEQIKELTGEEPKIFRFPWGSANQYLCNNCAKVTEILEEKGYTYYDWNVSAEDAIGNPTKYSILNNIKKNYKKYNEAIILMHDSSINKLTAELLPEIINMIKEADYEFDTLDHMEVPFQYSKD